MSRILEWLEGVICLVDGRPDFWSNQNEHDNRWDTALQRMQAAGVNLNKNIIDEKSIRPYPVKTEAVHKMKSPTCVSELRHFREMVNHLGKFSRKLADLSQPKEKLFEFQKQLDLGGSARISVQPDEGGAPHTYYFGPI